MKILLVAINAKYIHSNPAVFSLKQYAKKYNDNIYIEEYTINHSKYYILENIYKQKADVVAFSSYIWNYEYVLQIASELNKVSPGTEIWLGGPEVTYDSVKVLKDNPFISVVMKGEGEATFNELCQYMIEKNTEISKIKGITYKDGNNIVENPDRELLSMDDIPFYYDNVGAFENKIIYYEASRGCPFSCSYCLSSIERRVRFRNIDKVKTELQFFLDKKIPQVKFVDRTFNLNHKFTTELWNYILENDNGITNFHFEVSADLLDEEELNIIEKMRPGLIQLEIGVQSTNVDTISEINRTMDFEKLAGIVKRIKKSDNVHQHLDLIAGLPYEDFNSFKKSYNDVYELGPQQLQLGFLKVLKGSKMHSKCEEYGIKYQGLPPYEVLCTQELTFDEILQIKLVEEMTEVYYNSGQFNKTLILLKEAFETPFDMFLELGRYYEDRGLRGISHSRIRRYEILRDFILENDNKNLNIYDELMLFDLYSRENLKARPEWIKEIDIRDYVREFFATEEVYRKFLPDYSDYSSKQVMRMVHMEAFTNDYTLWTNKPMPIESEKKYIVLFDYKNRNVMDYSARTIVI